jgi:pyruvate/2-oxoglutarate dehydrogenase complex dihydrolipoamide dehydrogenase (E3) component
MARCTPVPSGLPLKSGKTQQVMHALAGRVDVGGTVTARDIIIATGSVPFVPPGIPIDGKTVHYHHCATHLCHAS